MTFARPDHISDLDTLPRMPAWVTSGRAETLEDVVFLSGAALAHLHLVLRREEVPQALFRDRLALRATEACIAFSGRPEREAELRDAVHLLRPGDVPGPAGETYLAWRRAVERPLSIKVLGRALPAFEPGQIAGWLDAGQGSPVTRAAMVLEAVLTDEPSADVPALVLADAALARALGWDHLVPLLSPGLKHSDLRKHGESKMETVTGASSDVGDLKPDDYVRMVTQDLEAIKSFLLKEHQEQNLNIRKTGIVAPEMAAPIALNFTMQDWRKIPYDDAPTLEMRTPRGQDIRSLVLISPMGSLPGMPTTVAIRELREPERKISFLFCVGAEDPQDKGETKKMHQQVVGRARDTAERIFYETYPYNLRGMALIGKKLKIEAHIVGFLKKTLFELEDEWQDRRSRLQR